MLTPFKLEPEYRDYVWGGQRLRPGEDITAEAWVIFADDKVANGPYTGRTLAEVAVQEGTALLGTRAVAKTGPRFPLLIKLLDCAQWLSLQVHPNDEQAERLAGEGFFGKTEAWYVVAAEAGAQLLGGFCPGVTLADMEQRVRRGEIMDIVKRHNVKNGDSIFIAPGMIHALGPGLLIYEVQQTSDITYRVYDWGRPLTAGRKLHIDQAIAVLDPKIQGELISSPEKSGTAQRQPLISSDYFKLELISGNSGAVRFDTHGASFSALTSLDNPVQVQGAGWGFGLGQYESLLVPAICGAFQVKLNGDGRVLHAYVP